MRAVLNDQPQPATVQIPHWLGGVLLLAGAGVAAMLVWQGVAAQGAPDPAQPRLSPSVALADIGILVFREGLECILVLSAIFASMVGENHAHRRPIVGGAAVAFLATVATWFIAVRILADLNTSVSALNLQAATGLLAVIVLLVIMNWFFHKVYWGGWITAHNRRKKALLREAKGAEISPARLWWGLGLLGFSSLYREGFEVVLFLQSYHLKMGNGVVLGGAALGLLLSAVVAVLTFVAHRRLPYRRMLVLTGILLGGVLLVMVGEEAQEMQQAGWIPTTHLAWLDPIVSGWMGVWFSIFPTVETLGSQALAAAIVVGSYFLAKGGGKSSAVAVPAA